MTLLHCDSLPTPLGDVRLAAQPDGTLCFADFADDSDRMLLVLRKRFGPELALRRAPLAATARLRAYFAGDVHALDGLPASPGGTPFQARTWQALRTIPAGETVSYGVLAARLGRPAAARAVGITNSLNPIGIVLPCHRVIGARGTLTGYAGGLERKRWLLEHERASLGLGQTRLAGVY